MQPISTTPTTSVKTPLPDPIRIGLARGWRVHGGPHAALPQQIDCDVVIVGSGAGGGITAEILSRAGLKVVIVEEGPLRSSSDFNQREDVAYPTLYQESAGRQTADKAITILQGRSVGGSTTVNWTSSFRTPPTTLAHWQTRFGLKDFTTESLAPFFAQAEQRLHIGHWPVTPNANNQVLADGAAKLGWHWGTMYRNVKGCWNLGSCGLGCPTNAKQSMLLTTIPTALDAGATLLVQTRADRFDHTDGRVTALWCKPVTLNSAPTAQRSPDAPAQSSNAVKIVAKHYVLSGGAINTPALLLRSKAPDPHGLAGQHTFLHPVVLSAAKMPQPIEGWNGAPQSTYSDHFQGWPQPGQADTGLGFKLEVAPMHPVVFAATAPGNGLEHAQLMRDMPHTQSMLSLVRDGFHPDLPGGHVQLRGDGSPVLDYPITETLRAQFRRALLTMAELQFAAGAQTVSPLHETMPKYTSWAQAKDALATLPMTPMQIKIVSAHVMGGCALAADAKQGLTRPDGQHWHLSNLSIHDGSMFPTSIGANPALSIYGIANRFAQGLAQRLTGKAATLKPVTV